MGAAAYIGRVGGLAVALGVGTAMATGHGVALADDAAAKPPSSESSDTTAASGSTDTKTTTTDNKTATEPSTPEPALIPLSWITITALFVISVALLGVPPPLIITGLAIVGSADVGDIVHLPVPPS